MKDFKQNDNNLAIAYYRYSSAGQNEASIDQQREEAQKYAAKHGYTIIKEYSDKAMSGADDDRPEFQLMLSEINRLKPAVLILWKTDRLSRDKITVAIAKDKIRRAGCSLRLVKEAMPEGSAKVIYESIIEGMNEFYLYNLSENVKRGLHYNAENGLYGRHIIGYKKSEDKHYIIDEKTAPIVEKIFREYADGKAMTEIIKDLTEQGIRSQRGNNFTVNSLRAILHNRSYIGEYHYAGVTIPNGMPAIVSEELFEEVQKRFARNKRQGSQRAKGLTEDNSPRYWLTGKLFCGECGESMHGMSGTSKTGAIHYYYACKNHRRKLKCPKKNERKENLESLVVKILNEFLSDSENLASLAVDVAEHYKQMHSNDDNYIESLNKQLKDTEKALTNLVKALEMGIFSETTQARLLELETQKRELTNAIEAEKTKLNILQDEYSIKHYFELYAKADFTNTDVRDMIFEYFIDKIYVYDDRILITCWYSDEQYEVSFDEIQMALAEFDSSVPKPAIIRSGELSYFVVKCLLVLNYRFENSL